MMGIPKRGIPVTPYSLFRLPMSDETTDEPPSGNKYICEVHLTKGITTDDLLGSALLSDFNR